jgi:hypothetical protein
MLLYGDACEEMALSALAQKCLKSAATVVRGDLDGLRALLIRCGQLEQGVEDLGAGGEGAEFLARRLTDEVSVMFCEEWGGGFKERRNAPHSKRFAREGGGFEQWRQRVIQSCRELSGAGEFLLKIKVPEGFAFYSLFPEQYCEAAARWSADDKGEKDKGCVVVGVRSIGTTLSAVVSATLMRFGWKARRMTVRPGGNCFDRRIELPVLEMEEQRALVVDEGPGLSGSSMAAVAEWLERSRITQIAFLPGHGNEPGSKAPPRVQRRWASTPRYFCPFDDVRWNGRSLAEMLARKSRQWKCEAQEIHDVSTGLWRRRAYEREEEWPAICKTFEQTKILCLGRNKNVLWKFCGLNSSQNGEMEAGRAMDEMAMLAQEGFVVAPLGMCMGFVGTEWICGERLNAREGKNPEVLKRIGEYIARAAKPGQDEEEGRRAVGRLAEMLYANTKEALGEDLAETTRALARAVAPRAVILTYGDGRLAPHEWVRTPEGRLLKTDCTGHSSDHTIVGWQSVLWDVAGAIIEWEVKVESLGLITEPLVRRGVSVSSEELRFYCACYAAFRMGMMMFGASQENDDGERKRLLKAGANYREKLRSYCKLNPWSSAAQSPSERMEDEAVAI